MSMRLPVNMHITILYSWHAPNKLSVYLNQHYIIECKLKNMIDLHVQSLLSTLEHTRILLFTINL